jgi:hypothetical protein
MHNLITALILGFTILLDISEPEQLEMRTKESKSYPPRTVTQAIKVKNTQKLTEMHKLKSG